MPNFILNGSKVAEDSITTTTLSLDLNGFIIGKAPDEDEKRMFRGQLKGIKVRGIHLEEDEALYAYQTSGFDTDPPEIPAIKPEPAYTPALANMIGWDISSDTQTGIDYLYWWKLQTTQPRRLP
ncbi:MAG: hypothetical protein U5K00_07820 [Melioribacteraceae bacterium]|nr:hypothetical protein [Melioribacteraceae bacterium]